MEHDNGVRESIVSYSELSSPTLQRSSTEQHSFPASSPFLSSSFHTHTPPYFGATDQLRPPPLRLPGTSSPRSRNQSSHIRTHSYSGHSKPDLSARSSFESDQIISATASSSMGPSRPRYLDLQRRPRSQRRRDYRQSTFVDESDVHLFAQALTGLESPSLPDEEAPVESTGPRHPSVSYLRHDVPYQRAENEPQIAYNTLLTPNIHVLPPDLEEPAESAPQRTIHYHPSSIPQPASPGSFSDAMIGLPLHLPLEDELEDASPPPDDELPDYWQSQREAAEQARVAAAGRAAELERRWARARHR